MSVPRSQRLIGFTSAGSGFSPVWTTPADHVTLVKSAIFFNGGSASASIALQLFYVGGSTTLNALQRTIAVGETTFWEGFVVLNPGDLMYGSLSAAGVVMWVSGAVLAGAPQFPPATRETPTQLPRDLVGVQPPLTEPGF